MTNILTKKEVSDLMMIFRFLHDLADALGGFEDGEETNPIQQAVIDVGRLQVKLRLATEFPEVDYDDEEDWEEDWDEEEEEEEEEEDEEEDEFWDLMEG